MTADLRPEDGVFFDLSARTKLRVTGADRFRFLNGQISNDLRKATAEHAIYACLLNAKGKINADVFMHVDRESFLLDADPELREALVGRLDRYVIADDVEITDASDEFALFHLLPQQPAPKFEVHSTVTANRFGCAGSDVWMPRSSREEARQNLSAQLPFCDDACADTFRIERGVPRWARELTDEMIPTEANLEDRAIDYAKGCYIGQEVISRIKMSGQTNKRLCGLVAADGRQLMRGMRLLADDGKEIGSITSATQSERVGTWIALGFVKRGHNALGTRIEARAPEGDGGALVEIVPLPFV